MNSGTAGENPHFATSLRADGEKREWVSGPDHDPVRNRKSERRAQGLVDDAEPLAHLDERCTIAESAWSCPRNRDRAEVTMRKLAAQSRVIGLLLGFNLIGVGAAIAYLAWQVAKELTQ